MPFYRGKPNFWPWNPARLAPDFASMARGLGLLCPLWEGGGNATNVIDGTALTAQSGTTFAAGGPGLVSSRTAIDAHYARATYQPFAGADLTIMGVANPAGSAASDGNGSLFSQRVGAAGSFAQVGLLLNFDNGGSELDGSISLIGLNGAGGSFGIAVTGQMDGGYHHFAGTYTQSSGALALYRDGASVASSTGTSGLLTSYTNQDTSIGGLGQITGNATYGLKRQIAWVAVWNRVLSAAEIQAAAANWNGLIEPSGLPVYLRVAQAAGSGALSGTIAAATTVSGNLTAAGALTGSSAATSTCSGTVVSISGVGTIATTSTCAGTLTGAGALTGTVAAASTCSGSIVSISGAGTIAAASTCSATLTDAGAGAGALTGTVAVASTCSGTAIGAGALTGTVAVTSGLSAPLVSITAAGTIAALSTVSGTLRGAGALSGTAAALSTVAGTLIGSGAVSGSSAATTGCTGTLRDILVGTVTVASTCAGTLTGAGALAGSLTAASGTPLSRLRDVSFGIWDRGQAGAGTWTAADPGAGTWTPISPGSAGWTPT